MFSNLSNIANQVDFAFLFVFALDAIVLIGNTIFMIWCCVRFSRKRNPVATNIHGNVGLEIIWTVIPTILVMMMFVVGLNYNKESQAPDDAMRVKVMGWKWSWAFTYDNGKENDSMKIYTGQTVPVLKLPVGKPVVLEMTSQDVLHSFYIPAFRVKRDVQPGGRISTMWFVPNKTGIYEVFCAEYCGEAHSKMYAKVEIVSQSEFDAWYGQAPVKLDPAQLASAGQEIYNVQCAVCHSIDGSRKIGPSFKGIWGRTAKLTGGVTKKTDADYIRKSIKMPNAEIVEGYAPAMPMLPLNDDKIDQIIAYMKTLK